MLLFLVSCLIEALLDGDPGEDLLADVDAKGCSEGGVAAVDKGEADALVQGNRVVAGRDDTNLGTVLELHGIAGTRYGLVLILFAIMIFGIMNR